MYEKNVTFPISPAIPIGDAFSNSQIVTSWGAFWIKHLKCLHFAFKKNALPLGDVLEMPPMEDEMEERLKIFLDHYLKFPSEIKREMLSENILLSEGLHFLLFH